MEITLILSPDNMFRPCPDPEIEDSVCRFIKEYFVHNLIVPNFQLTSTKNTSTGNGLTATKRIMKTITPGQSWATLMIGWTILRDLDSVSLWLKMEAKCI